MQFVRLTVASLYELVRKELVSGIFLSLKQIKQTKKADRTNDQNNWQSKATAETTNRNQADQTNDQIERRPIRIYILQIVHKTEE